MQSLDFSFSRVMFFFSICTTFLQIEYSLYEEVEGFLALAHVSTWPSSYIRQYDY